MHINKETLTSKELKMMDMFYSFIAILFPH
jgi:hypothetical protein